MIKKITLVFISALIIIMSVPFAASAANTASFRVRLAEQTDKTATVVVEFADGMGFGALDFEVKYNSLKLKLTEAKLGSGYKLFRDAVEEKGLQIIGSMNSESNPIKVSMATLEAFQKTDNDGILARFSFSKIGGTKVSESDVKLTVTNCQTTGLKDITASVSYEMDAANGNSGGNVTEYAQQTSKDNMDDKETTKKDSEIGEPGEDGAGENQTDVQTNAADGSTENAESIENSEAVQKNTSSQKAISNKSKTITIVAVAVILAAGIAVLVYIILKNKKKQETEL